MTHVDQENCFSLQLLPRDTVHERLLYSLSEMMMRESDDYSLFAIYPAELNSHQLYNVFSAMHACLSKYSDQLLHFSCAVVCCMPSPTMWFCFLFFFLSVFLVQHLEIQNFTYLSAVNLGCVKLLR